ncbi:MAG: HAD family hydrolase [Planctomycetes bacterium]|nr:HAD family hydrolase [Planctomycetota bacterium]
MPQAEIKAVIFDMDGTLIDSPLDFELIHAQTGVPRDRPLLEYMDRAGPEESRRMYSILARHEERAALDCTLREGAAEAIDSLRRMGCALALLTRNSARSVRTVLGRLGLQFDCWLSRDDEAPKPSPVPVLRIADRLKLTPGEVLMVGDYRFDVMAGHAAGARTAFLKGGKDAEAPRETDFVLEDLRELPPLLARWNSQGD